MRPFRPDRIPKPKAQLPINISLALDLEIGCGVGKHAIEYALKNPDRTLIALDRSSFRLSKMKRSMQAFENLSNLIVICEDADRFVVHEIKNDSLENIFLLYPNPYPKESQANKRWHRMPFMACLIDKLKAGGKIHLATNMEFYALEAKAYFQDTWNLTLIHDQVFDEKNPMPFAPRTHFEKKYFERGQCIFDLVWSTSD